MVIWLVNFCDQVLQNWERRCLRKARKRDPDYDPYLDYP